MRNTDIEDNSNTKLEWKLLRELLPRFRPYVWSLSLCAVFLGVFSLLSLIGPLLVRYAIDVVFVNKDMAGLIQTTILYIGVLFLSFWFNYLQQVRLETVGQRIIKGIRIDIFSHLTRLGHAFFDHHPVGQLLSRVESDTEALRQMFTYTVVTLLTDVLVMIGMITVMFLLSPRLTLILLTVAPLIIFIVRHFNRKIVPIYVDVRHRTGEIYAFLEEYLRGARIVQVFDQEENIIRRMDEVNKARASVEYRGERLSSYFGHLVFLFSIVATALVLGIGGIWVLNRPDLVTIGTLAAFLGYIQRFFGPIFHISEQMNVIQRAFAGAKRINEILNTTPQRPVELIPGVTPPYPSPIPEGIEFRNVWFAYKGEEWVLKDVSFTLPKGKRLALVGATGGGKTSIASLLFRFYDAQKGHIFLNGTDIRTMTLQGLRKHMGLVLQDIVLFPGTILDNLRLDASEIHESMVLKALEVVKANEIVDSLPQKLNTVLAEHGGNLSMGERQLLSFARALVFDPEILVLDEATSSVDPYTEQKIQEALKTLLTGRTALIIAHRLQTILECDEILVIDKGCIKERGTHQELLESGGIYRELYQIQIGAGEAV